MVVEHLHEPVEVLRRLAAWTKPRGWIALSVPNAAALEFRIFGNAWFALQLPTHLYHYTPSTITNVLDQGGWKVTRIMHQRTLTNLLASIGYVLEDHKISTRLGKFLVRISAAWYVHIALFPLAFLLSLIGQTGRMTVWAQKIDN